MSKPKMVLCDREKPFAEKIYEYLYLTEGENFETFLFTNESNLKEFIKDNRVELLIIGEGIDIERESLSNVETRIFLSESKEDKSDEEIIYKYSPRDEIARKILKVYADTKERDGFREGGGRLKIIGIYSPIKRCFQTTFAITLGQILAKKHKTLYLNLESFSGFDVLLNKISRLNLMDLLYYISCKEDDLKIRLDSIKDTIGGLDYIPPAQGFIEFSKIEEEHWMKLVKGLAERTDYEYLILDLSEEVAGLFDLLRICDRVFTLTDKSRISDAKMAQYYDMLRNNSFVDVTEKTKIVNVPVFYDIPKELELLSVSELAGYIKKNILGSLSYE